MSNGYFSFKRFTVYQDRCAMKVGTDGVLLGAWVDVKSAHSVLDIGAGTGLIALMLAQRSTAEVTAVEIDPEAAQQATENITRSPWQDRIILHSCSIQAFEPNVTYDVIVSNPPYFNRSLKSPKEERTTARHTDTLSYDDLLTSVVRLLDEKGRFSVILPFAEKETFLKLANRKGLYCSRLTEVLPKPASQPKRFMAELKRTESETTYHTLIIEADGRHQYSEEYKQLTKDFYL